MKQLVTVSNALLCATLDGSGLDAPSQTELLAHAGLAAATVRDITARTSITRLARLWKRLLVVTGDPHIGLAIGSTVRTERFGLGAHAAQHGETLRQVLLRFVTYAPLVNDLLECRLEETPPVARFVGRLHWDVLGLERHALDILFAAIVKFARERMATPLRLHEVRVTHALATGEPVYRRVLGAPIRFGTNRYELVFDVDQLDESVRAGDAELGQLLDSFAKLELARIPVVTDVPARMAQVIRGQLAAGTKVELAAIAAELAMTPRSLQRKLRDHATSFSTVLDEVRRALAPDWLADPEGNVEQVGFRLGYSEPTAFIRAFRKWYGMTPGAFRRGRVARKADS